MGAVNILEFRTCRARFPADRKMLIRSVFVRFQSSRIPAFVCGPREARGQRLASLGVGGGGASLRSDGAPRFARTEHLASLGQAELRKWLSSVGACVSLCSANPWKGAAMEGSRHLSGGLPKGRPLDKYTRKAERARGTQWPGGLPDALVAQAIPSRGSI